MPVPMTKRFLRVAAVAAAVIALIGLWGCQSAGYYRQAIWGQARILLAERPISNLMDDPDTPPALRSQLAYVLALREFASRELLLPVGGSYLEYVDLGRPFVVWNVSAAPPLSLEPKTWCFPIAGCTAYRAYFAPEDARDYAQSLSREGYDAFVWGASAYSTLGWFDDPVLNTFLFQGKAQLTALIFHELAHRLLYVSGDSAFNESFANAVAQIGLRRWSSAQGDPELLKEYERLKQGEDAFLKLVKAGSGKLEALYASDLPTADKKNRKAEILAAMQRDFDSARKRTPALSAYAGWFGADLNNAALALASTYHDLVPAFERLFAQSDGRLAVFYERCRVLAAEPVAERQAQLRRLMGRPE